jgi:hypothetical protein
MHPALSGVIVPTVALIVLAAIPYLDRSKEGQGTWFGTLNAVRISVFSAVFAAAGTLLLILYDGAKHVQVYEMVTGSKWPFGADRPSWLPDVGIIQALWDLIFIPNVRAIQTQWTWDSALGHWPDSFTRIPIPLNGTSWPQWGGQHGQPAPQWYQDIPGWLTGLYWYDLNLNLPAFLVELLIPTIIMTALPALMVYILWRIGWVNNRRDVMLAIFSGFISVYWVMTIVGAAFRGAGQELVPPWDVPRIDG